jgi:hypothetical protein
VVVVRVLFVRGDKRTYIINDPIDNLYTNHTHSNCGRTIKNLTKSDTEKI